MSADAQNPWLGLVPYGEGDAPFFHGRVGETGELLALIERDTLSVLYGVSGLGKTSVLQAGLFPRLRAGDALPVHIRLDIENEWARFERELARSGEGSGGDGKRAQALQLVRQKAAGSMSGRVFLDLAINYERQVGAPAPQGSGGAVEETFWEYFHRRDRIFWSAKNRPLTPVLVFDQFEEIFTLGQQTPERAARSAAFLEDLAGLIYNRPPAHVLAAVERGEDPPFEFEPVPLRVVLALREDFLPHLAGLRERGFPTIRRNEMRLLPMSEAAAREAIEIPGRGLLEAGVADDILAFVAGRRGGDVEPALLSVVLRELNAKRRDQALPRITPALLSGSKEEILGDFYEGAFAGLDPAVRLFVEDGLVSPGGFRDSRAVDDALSRPGITQEALDTIVDRRLLRYEDRAGGGRRVELAHDLLCGVTAASRAVRATREANVRRLAEEAKKRAEAEAAARAASEQAAIQHRRLRKVRWVAVGFAVLGFLAVAALVFAVAALRRAREAEAAAVTAKNEAQAQEKRAEEARAEASASAKTAHEAKDAAVAAKKDADDLINFMQYNLRDSLKKIGSLKLMDDINGHILKYQQDHPPGEDDDARREQSVALDQHGDVLFAEGDLAGALKSYSDSLAIAEALAKKSPDNYLRQRDVLISYRNVGDALKAQGDLSAALARFHQSLEVAEAQVEKYPSDADLQDDLTWAQTEIGRVLATQGNLDDALTAFDSATRICKASLAKTPDRTRTQWALAAVDREVGDIRMTQSNLPLALRAYQDNKELMQGLVTQDPTDTGRLRDLSSSETMIGDALQAQGDLPGALQSYRDSLAICVTLTQKDPDNAGWQSNLLVCYDRIGDVLQAQNDLPGALKSYRDSLTLSETMVKKNPENAEWQRDLSVRYNNIGGVLKAQGDLPGALKYDQDGLAIRQALVKMHPENTGWQRDLSVNYNSVGDVLKAQGDLPGALQNYRDSLTIREMLIAKDPRHPGRQRDLSFSLANVGLILEAQKSLPEALDYYERSLAIDEKLVQANPANPVSQKDFEWDQKAVARLRESVKSTPAVKSP